MTWLNVLLAVAFQLTFLAGFILGALWKDGLLRPQVPEDQP